MFRVACLVSLSFALSQPASSQSCAPERETANRHFVEAHSALFDYLSFAHLCAPVLSEAFVAYGISKAEDLLAARGISRNDAVILAEEINRKAVAASGKYDLLALAKKIGKEDTISLVCIDQLKSAMHQFEVAHAKMEKAQCSP